MLEQRRPAVPGHVAAARHDVVAEPGRDRDRHDGAERKPRREIAEVGGNPVEHVLRMTDEVHLVDGERDMADAEQRADHGMPPGLRQYALARIDQDDCGVRIRGAGRHVAGVLLVARRVRHDERALLRREIAVGDVDGDPLLALRLEPVEQQGEVDVFAGRAIAPGVVLQRGKLVVEDRAAFMQEAADQSRFSVVNGTAGEHAQQPAAGAGLGDFRDVCRRGLHRHQK